MTENPESGKVVHRVIEQEMKQAYVDYAMSVIVGRALPDARDGLKPVHRRILFAMKEAGLLHNKPFKKSAHIVGKVLAETHPHGDLSVYDAMVRMAQDFSLRYTLVDGQGNWGSIDGDNAAAYRYCVTGDTLVMTDKGFIPIQKISDKEETPINLQVQSFDGKINRATRFFNSGKHKIFRMTTRAGYVLEGSQNHPVLTWDLGIDYRPTLVWKKLDTLKENDVALISRHTGLFARHSFDLRKYWPSSGYRNNVELPKEMNDSLAFLLGALVSEGSFHRKQILFNNKDMMYYNQVKSILFKEFPGVQLYERDIKGGCRELSIYEQRVVLFLQNIGFYRARSDRKEIPFSVLQSRRDHIKNFLVGLFEGDGGVTYIKDKRHGGQSVHVNYDSKSRYLIRQLKTVLLAFGVVSQFPQADKRHECFKLIISGYDNVFVFYQELGFFSERKKGLIGRINSINSLRMSKTDFIPFLSDYLRMKYSNSFVARNNFDRHSGLKRHYKKLVKIVDKNDCDLLDWLLENHFYFDQVRQIVATAELREVFSLRVNSPCHSFIANGFVNHNTEARLSELAEEMLTDIDKETVNFKPNFDGSMNEPEVLPSKIPQLFVNGSTGIAVGMATNIPTHNLREVCDAVVMILENPSVDTDALLKVVPGPDFPTGAQILGRQGIIEAYKTGRGKVTVKAVARIEDGRIIVTEIPYMVNKAQMIQEMADLVRNKRIEGIRTIRDESNIDGIRVVIELKSGVDGNIVLNQLYTFSRLKTTFGIIFLAVVNNEPQLLTLKSGLQCFINHRKEVVRRRTQFELRQAEEKAHVLEGLLVALSHIDAVVAGIKASATVDDARVFLIDSYQLSEIQARAILDMKLQKLASLEQQHIRDEHAALVQEIVELKSILASEQRILDIIKKETLEVKERFGDNRKTVILDGGDSEVIAEHLIENKDMVVTISHSGYIKRVDLDTYKMQRRGGKGVIAAGAKEEDWMEDFFVASAHTSVLFFTNKGQVHWLKVYEIPEGGRQAKGKPIVNLLRLQENEYVSSFVPVRSFETGKFLFMATKNGVVKKTELGAFSNPRNGGIRALTLDEGDELVGVEMTDGVKQIMLATRQGMAIRFSEQDVRAMGRSATGVWGITLEENDLVVALEVVEESTTLLTVTSKGYGKRTAVVDYRLIARGGKGVINSALNDKIGHVVGVKAVTDGDELMLISRGGVAIRMACKDISVIGRATQGVRLMRLDEGDELVSFERIVSENGSEESSEQKQ